MTSIRINERIAFLRKQKGLTQKQLANLIGVTNQAVSKWESAQCCPDIQLLPDIAKIFEVSIDDLVGYKATSGLGEICLKIKDYFSSLPEKRLLRTHTVLRHCCMKCHQQTDIKAKYLGRRKIILLIKFHLGDFLSYQNRRDVPAESITAFSFLCETVILLLTGHKCMI